MDLFPQIVYYIPLKTLHKCFQDARDYNDFLEEYTAMLVWCKYLLGDVVMYDTITPMTDCQDIASSSHLTCRGGATQQMPSSPLILTMNVDDEDDGYE